MTENVDLFSSLAQQVKSKDLMCQIATLTIPNSHTDSKTTNINMIYGWVHGQSDMVDLTGSESARKLFDISGIFASGYTGERSEVTQLKIPGIVVGSGKNYLYVDNEILKPDMIAIQARLMERGIEVPLKCPMSCSTSKKI